MQAGKPKDQSLAISYSVQRKAKRKKMADGGPVSAKTEKRPMPEQMDNDRKQASAVSAKPIVGGQWDQNPVIPRPKTQPIKHPTIVQSPVFKVKLRDQEDDLESSQAPNNGPQRQPPEMYNEEGPDRQGPSTPSLKMKMMAEGGMAQDEIDDQAHDSMAAAIMAKRRREPSMSAESDSDIDHQMMMAEGGLTSEDEINGADSIYSDDSDQVDLKRNAEEDANMEDQSSFDALRKENYSESTGLRQMGSPEDSNEHGHEIESDAHDRVSAIRRRMASKRQFGK